MIIPTAKKKSLIYTLQRICTNAGVCYTLTQSETGKQNKKRDGSRSGTVLMGQMVERRKGLHTHTRHRNTHTGVSIYWWKFRDTSSKTDAPETQ